VPSTGLGNERDAGEGALLVAGAGTPVLGARLRRAGGLCLGLEACSLVGNTAFGVAQVLELHQQQRFADLLRAIVEIAARLGAPCHLAALMRDAGAAVWHFTALIDAEGAAMGLDTLDVPLGPFSLRLPVTCGPWPLATVLGDVWGEEACLRIEETLQTRTTICVPINGPSGLCGALLALVDGGGSASLLLALLAHAAVSAERHLGAGHFPVDGAVLNAAAFARRATDEVARAERYQRHLSLLVLQHETNEDLHRSTAVLALRVRHWDALCQPSCEPPSLVLLLPETGRAGARAFLRRLGAELAGVRMGIATLPDDGYSLDQLQATAKERAALAGDAAQPAAGADDVEPAAIGSRKVLSLTEKMLSSGRW